MTIAALVAGGSLVVAQIQPTKTGESYPMTWRGIVGKSFSPDGFEKYVATLKFNLWRPRFIVVHNTSAPDLKTWRGWQARKPSITDEKWAQNLVGFYRDQQGWSAGPHLFITPAGILAFSPLTGPGTHSPSWNSVSWGIETVGEFETEAFDGLVRDNLIAALAILHIAAGLQPEPYDLGVRGLHFHKEDHATTHKTCPGRHLVKADLVRAVQAKIVAMTAGDHQPETVTPVQTVRAGKVNTDGLNVRADASAKSVVVRSLKKGASIRILGQAKNGETTWYHIDDGYVSAQFVDAA
jgi:hypothetical protein